MTYRPGGELTLVAVASGGALSTFSTQQLEVVELGRDGHAVLAAAYLCVSVAAGLLVILPAAGVARGARLGAG